jgi:hypothetical protein
MLSKSYDLGKPAAVAIEEKSVSSPPGIGNSPLTSYIPL